MSGENYVNTASVATTAAPVGPSDLTITVANYTGYPAAPYWAEIAKGTASAEIVRVTNVAGLSLTITRGQGGTSATSHGAGVNFELVAPADFFNRTETHMAATNAHGVTGNVVGTSGAQTVQDKNFRGAFRSDYTDALPVGITASFESNANNASARDGFVHRNTAGDAARAAFLAQQSGTDRFKVTNTGNVTINPSTGTALTVTGNSSVSGNETVGGTLGVTGATTLSGGVSTTTVTASGTVSGGSLTTSGSVTGLSASILGPIHAGGALDTDSTLVVDGTSTLTGAVSTGAGLTVGTTLAATLGVTAWGGWHAIPSVNTVADVTSPVSGMVVFEQSTLTFKRRVGSVWVPLGTPRAMLRQTDTIDRGSGGWFAIPLNTEDKDTLGGHSTSSNTSRYTATIAGSYEFTGGGGWSANANGSRGLRWAKSGVAVPQADVLLPATPGGSHAMTARTYQVDLAVGDYVELECWHNTGGTLTTSGGHMAVKYLGGD